MRVAHWCMLGATILLLVCEVIISQLCNSFIILVDGFHTLFILLHMALKSQTSSTKKNPLSSLDSASFPPNASSSSSASASPPANPPAGSPVQLLPGAQAAMIESTPPDQPPTPPEISPASLHSSLSYTDHRMKTVGDFISGLVLVSLCTSYFMEIISSSLEAQRVQHPLLLVEVSALSLLLKMLVLWLNLDQQKPSENKHGPEINRKGLGEEEDKGRAEPGRVQFTVGDSVNNGALVICNPASSIIPETDSRTPEPQVKDLRAAAGEVGEVCEGVIVAADRNQPMEIEENPRDDTFIKHPDSQNASIMSPVCKSSYPTESPASSSRGSVRLLMSVRVIQGLCSPLLALIKSLVMLLIGPRCLHGSGSCSFLVYLDLSFSILAVIILIATVTPRLHRYGLLLLQATPPHICVSDLGQKIAGVPGVRGVHELHIWQLTESSMVASVHVHCHASFQAHRCDDLMRGVTKVLQSVGVNYCTIQPEFASCSGSSAGSADATPVTHGEDLTLPHLLACSLACAKSCADNMCCSTLEEKTRILLAPPTGETKEEPQALVIENTLTASFNVMM